MKKNKNVHYERLKKMKKKNIFWFVSGFVDGDGSFSISLTRQKNNSTQGWKWIINPLFQVYQHGDNLWFLEFLRDEVYKTGRIHQKTSPHNVYTFTIENRITLYEKILPFFRKYRLATKDDDFQKFAYIIEMIHQKEHLNLKGFKKIVNMAFLMNKRGKQRKFSKKFILETLNEQFKSK